MPERVEDRRPLLVPVLAGLAAFGLRLSFIGDMEFKADEKWIADFLPTVYHRPFSPLAEISAHSGIAHSNFVYYFMRLVSFGSDDPLVVGTCIAAFNAAAIAVALYLARASRRLTLTFALCATGTGLVLHSRKIWQPDLVAAWDVLAVGLLAWAVEQRFENPRALRATVVAGFCLVMAGHMYLPGAAVAAIAGLTVLAVLWSRGDKKAAAAWTAGVAAGGLTFVPYAYAMLTRAPGAFAETNGAYRSFDYFQLERVTVTAFTLPSPLHVYTTYLKPWNAWIFKNHWTGLMSATYAVLNGTIVAWTAVFWAALARTWQLRREAARDPLVVSALALLVGIPALLLITRLGDYLHYWLGTFPFAYALIAWAAEHGPDSPTRRFLSRATWACCALSLLVTVLFLATVHEGRGLPGEYGPAYSSGR